MQASYKLAARCLLAVSNELWFKTPFCMNALLACCALGHPWGRGTPRTAHRALAQATKTNKKQRKAKVVGKCLGGLGEGFLVDFWHVLGRCLGSFGGFC